MIELQDDVAGPGDLKHLLERAGAGAGEGPAPVTALVGRWRRRRRARRAAAAGALASALSAGLAFMTVVPLGGEAQPPAGLAPVIDPSAGTVQLGGVRVQVPDGWSIEPDGRCAKPRTVVVVRGVGMTGCGDGPSIVLSTKVSQDWASGQGPGDRGVFRVGGAPVWGTLSADRMFLGVPYARAFVEIDASPAVRPVLLEQITVVSPSRPPVLRSAAVEGYTIGSVTGAAVAIGSDPVATAALVKALEAAPVVPVEERCLPERDDQVYVTLQPSSDSDPDTGPIDQYTSLVTALRGGCRQVYSSTGAVVQPTADFYRLIAASAPSAG